MKDKCANRRGDPDDICARCKGKRIDVRHCKSCCGWGVTKGIKSHKFRLDKKATATKRAIRPEPTASDFVRMMEAWAANEIDGTEATKHWGLIYEMAHVCFVNQETGLAACPHPEWTKLFWKQYDGVKSYWGEK